MANPEHLKILDQGIDAWNKWRRGNPGIIPDLYGADLHGAKLVGANLRGATLIGACLVHANLRMASLVNSEFTNAEVGWTIFGDNDLSMARGLETVKHFGPSTIGIDTIYKSKGNIPEVFLRGAGVPEDFIVYMRSLVGKPIDFYSCFISYSTKDDDFAQRLYADLQAKNVRCWKFDENAKWGEPLWGEIDTAIRHYDKLVVICSEHSLQSQPVIREIERALQKEDREHRNVLFPIRIDDYLFDKWEHPRKADVVSKVAGDFRGSDNLATYSKAFPRFLDALNRPQQASKTG
ncbi:MAG: toll/interleukin-1 receptor domain-containing protein [Terriglobia bacterium]